MTTQLKSSFYIFASAFFFGTYGIWSRMMGGSFDALTQGWTRSMLVLLILIPAGIIMGSFKPIIIKDLRWWLLYCLPGSLVIPFYYYGYTHLEIGTATLVFYASLTLTSYVLGFVAFGERMTRTKLISLLLGMTGLVLVYMRSVSANSQLSFPLLVTVLSGICGGIEVVFTKKLSDRYSPLQLTVMIFIVSLLLCLALSYMVHGFTTLSTNIIAWTGNILHGFATVAAFFLVVLGYKDIEPSIGGIIGLSEILFGILFGVLLYHETLTDSVIGGFILISTAALLPNATEILRRVRSLKN